MPRMPRVNAKKVVLKALVEEELKKRVEESAHQSYRSVAKEITAALTWWVARREKQRREREEAGDE